MKKKYFAHVWVIMIILIISCSSENKDEAGSKSKRSKKSKVELKTAADSASYAFGVLSGDAFINMDKVSPVDIDIFAKGTKEALNMDETAMTTMECQRFLQKYMMEIQPKIAEFNKKEGEDYLEKNKKSKGVNVTASGLQYKVIKEGNGKTPGSTDRVKCNYEGKLINGKIFDSSYERGRPAQFVLNKVIPGWSEGLQLMKEGSTYMLYVPSNLAYGERGSQSIGPNETLVFKVELLEVMDSTDSPPIQLPQSR